jgi:uncharacterized membrane protein YphA (DoxX/SURF4 family)
MWFVLVTARLLLAGVLLVAGVSKLRSPSALREFAASVHGLGLAQGRFAVTLSVAVGTVEVGVAGLLVTPRLTLSGLGCASLLLLAFTAVVWHALRRGNTASCRCFGSSGGQFRRDHLWRNILLSALAVGTLAATAWAQPAAPSTLDAWLCTAFAAVVGVTLALPVIRWDDCRFLAGQS